MTLTAAPTPTSPTPTSPAPEAPALLPAPRPLSAAALPLWLVTMPTTSPTGARGEQTFAVRAPSYAEALGAAAATAHARPALRHRRGAHIDTAAARATLHR
ncbi:hypothetical protein Kpho02_21650 [Kitasatospora phosalacinea]|uniref:Uncharacterized protein n=1 Tax=Kitasatospora phosalacinea TaxID=2065 RepID=A0A9W6Q6W3_9ACTN|nr:hypothetical protein [Kitasatospora phosalacinea]GLW69866.1 hypothetical protein Kpho02_21650 [Kitasatospora phosalacinea]